MEENGIEKAKEKPLSEREQLMCLQAIALYDLFGSLPECLPPAVEETLAGLREERRTI